MGRKKRVIQRFPENDSNHYLVDACFLVNKYLKPEWIKDEKDRKAVQECRSWWEEITKQIKHERAKVYIPNICIAEAFKVLAKKNFKDRIFKYPQNYQNARTALHRDIHLTTKDAAKQRRKIRFHDIETNRDIIISVDRFFEKLHKLNVRVEIVDLLLLATGKYLIDFFDFNQRNLFIVTIDGQLYQLARSLQDVPQTFNPHNPKDSANKVFVDSTPTLFKTTPKGQKL